MKTNRFTAVLICLIAACFLLNHLSRVRTYLDMWSVRLEQRLALRVLLLISVCLLGVGLRALWLDHCQYRPAFEWSTPADPNPVLTEYDQINISAKAITQGSWFRDIDGKALVRRPIGYPILLAGFYKLFGARIEVAYALQLVLFVLSVLFLYLLSRQIFGSLAAILSALIFAVYPLSIYSASLTLDEHLFLPLWYGGLYLLFREIAGRPVKFRYFWYGILFGYAAMTRAHAIFMPLIVALVYFRLRYSWRKIAGGFFIVLFFAQLINLPWVIRNYREFGTPILYLAGQHYLYFTNNPQAFVTREHYDQQRYPKPGEEGYSDQVRELEEAALKSDWKTTQSLGSRLMRQWILGHPLDFLTLGTQKVLHFMSPDRSRGLWAIDLIQESLKRDSSRQLPPETQKRLENIAFGFYYVILYTFFFGAAALARRWSQLSRVSRDSLLCLAFCFISYLGLHFILYPERKYRFPLEPLMMLVSVQFLLYLIRNPFLRPKR